MKMSELIRRYGDDKVQFQNLDQCATDLNMGKKGTRITFGTEQRIDLKGTEQLGLVLWLDRKTVADIVAADKEQDADVASPLRSAPARSEPSSSSDLEWRASAQADPGERIIERKQK